MLLIKTYLDNSNIHGIGVFTFDDIKKNQKVWMFNVNVDLVFTPVRYKNLISIAEIKKYVENFIYKQNGIYILHTDHARYINHSDNPNIFEYNYNPHSMYASRDIQAGEEITCNYRLSSDKDDINTMRLFGVK